MGERLREIGSIVVTVVVIGTLVLASCGGRPGAGSPLDGGELGGSCSGGEVDLISLEGMLGDGGHSWYEIDAWEITGGPMDPPADRTVTATASALPVVDGAGNGEGEPMAFTAHDQLAEDIEGAVDAGYSVLARTGVSQSSADYLGFAAAIGTDETVHFLGLCGSRYNDGFESLVERITPDLSPASALRLHASSGADSPFLALPEDETPPSTEMVLDPATAPAELLASLESVRVEFEVPEAWAGSTAVVCTKASAGWNDCASLSAVRASHTVSECPAGQACDERTVDAGGVIEISGYVAPDRKLEIWLLPESGDPDGVAGPISVVDLPTSPEGGASHAVVKVRFAGAATRRALDGTRTEAPADLTVEATVEFRSS